MPGRLLSKSMQIAMEILKLDKLTVIYPGSNTIKLTKDIFCIGLEEYLTKYDFLRLE